MGVGAGCAGGGRWAGRLPDHTMEGGHRRQAGGAGRCWGVSWGTGDRAGRGRLAVSLPFILSLALLRYVGAVSVRQVQQAKESY